jgi:hypothetical protein
VGQLAAASTASWAASISSSPTSAIANELNADAERSLVTNQAAVEELQRQQQEVTMVATAVTEMASATMEIAGNAENTAAAQQSAQSSEQGKILVNQTRQSINNLAEEVGQATGVIGELSRHAQAISGILSTIQGIAEQTNLLALNAPSKRPAPANRVAVSPWWRTRCGCCRAVPRISTRRSSPPSRPCNRPRPVR